MTFHPKFIPVIAAVVAFALPAQAQDDTPLGQEMEKLSKALKVVNRNIADASAKEANLARIITAKQAVEASLKLEPAMAKDVPAADKEKFLADYKAAMQETSKALDELKDAIAGDKVEEAQKIMEKLNAQKKDGHKKFQKED